MSRIEVVGGDFRPHPHSRFQGAALILHSDNGGRLRQVRYPPAKLKSFEVCSGFWERELSDASGWMKALAAATLAGAPAAGANFMLAEFFTGQKPMVTWLNAVLGGAAAAMALKSRKQVRFRARFRDGEVLEARAVERELTLRLPHLLRGALAARN